MYNLRSLSGNLRRGFSAGGCTFSNSSEVLLHVPPQDLRSEFDIRHLELMINADAYRRMLNLFGQPARIVTGYHEQNPMMRKKMKGNIDEIQMRNVKIMNSTRDTWKKCGIGCDTVVSLASAAHKGVLTNLWNKLSEKGVIETGIYDGWYNEDAGYFIDDSQAEVVHINSIKRTVQVSDGRLIYWHTEPGEIFKPQKIIKEYMKWIRSDVKVFPEYCVNSLIQSLEDFSEDFMRGLILSESPINRPTSTPVPNNSELDISKSLEFMSLALTNSDYWAKEGAPSSSEFNVQFVSKDQMINHLFWWPAILLSVGIPPIKKYVVHGSSAIGAGMFYNKNSWDIQPSDVVREFGMDAVRGASLYGSLIFSGKYNEKLLESMRCTLLMNTMGNMLLRIMSDKLNKSKSIPLMHSGNNDLHKINIKSSAEIAVKDITKSVEKLDFRSYIKALKTFAESLNREITCASPWRYSSQETQQMDDLKYDIIEGLRVLFILAQPVFVESSKKFLDYLQVPEVERTLKNAEIGSRYLHTPKPESSSISLSANIPVAVPREVDIESAFMNIKSGMRV